MIRLKIRELKIGTGGPYIAIMNHQDAELLDIHNGDRIRICHGKRCIIAKVDIAKNRKLVKKGTLSLFHEAFEKLKAERLSDVIISIEGKPKSISHIIKKLDGMVLTEKEIDEIIKDIVDNKLDDIETTYFVAACTTRLMSEQETVFLTRSMIKHGDILRFRKKPVIDKHCIGGVAGNRTTMILVPVLAANGILVPKTSSRSITSPAGTADTMECISQVSFPIKKIKKVIKRANACIVWGGAINLAPADDRIIRVEHPVSIDSQSQLIASILAKKASVSATHVLIDIPVGKGAKIESIEKAMTLKRQFERIGKKAGMKVIAMITDGSTPIGNGIGPVLEARDVLYVLNNDKKAPIDLKEKSIILAGRLLEMAGKARKGMGSKIARNPIESGKAMESFRKIVEEQGYKEMDPERLRTGRFKLNIKAEKKGHVSVIRNDMISKIARLAGAPKDKSAGIFLIKKKNDAVKKGDVLYTIYSNSKERLKFAKHLARKHHSFIII